MRRESIKQIMKFAVVGIFNTLVDWTVFYIMFSQIGFYKGVAQVIATSISMCGSYIINKRWTFKEKSKAYKKQIEKFIVTNLLAMSITIVLMYIFNDLIHLYNGANNLFRACNISYRLTGDMKVMFCKIVASGLAVTVNFIGNKFWVFKKSTLE